MQKIEVIYSLSSDDLAVQLKQLIKEGKEIENIISTNDGYVIIYHEMHIQ